MGLHISGRLDRFDDGELEGWAINPDTEEERERLEVLIDGVAVDVVIAGLYREDLDRANIRGGYAKFLYHVPKHYYDGQLHSLDMRHFGTTLSIDNVPQEFTLGTDGTARLTDQRNWALQTLVLKDDTDSDSFAVALRARRRVALVSTYHTANSFMLYQRALFKALVNEGFVVVVVHASPRDTEHLTMDAGQDCYTILKRNVGYDFGSWAVGSFTLGSRLDQVDEILLLNDSVIELEAGGLGSLIARARAIGADVVGITDSYERQYHLQSYFIWLGVRVCRSSMLRMFMADFSFSSDKDTVIREGELSFTARLQAEGFSIACLNPYEMVAQHWLSGLDRIMSEMRSLPGIPRDMGGGDYRVALFEQLDRIVSMVLRGTPVNPGHFFWDTLIESCDCRLLKRELVIVNPCHVPTYYRLGLLLAALPDARKAIIDLRQCYGGELIPSLWNPALPSRGSADQCPDETLLHQLDLVPLPKSWFRQDAKGGRFVQAIHRTGL